MSFIHPFFLVNFSPWPILASFSSFVFFCSFIFFLYMNMTMFFILSSLILLMCSFLWWRDIIREATFCGNHSMLMIKMFKFSMILFIISELFFFVSFFWNFFHNSLAPDINIGMLWPPYNISLCNPYNIPLLNTIILLSSGFTITWTHHNIISNINSIYQLLMTIILGIYFTILQIFEYINISFTISDSIFGTSLFITTGFHGIHVIIGTSFLMFNFFRLYFYHFNNKHHFSFEASAWYWHFVDVIWIFLYIFFYWWIF